MLNHKNNVIFFHTEAFHAFFLLISISTLPLQSVGLFCILYVVFLLFFSLLLTQKIKRYQKTNEIY